jgi:hypothetical protein
MNYSQAVDRAAEKATDLVQTFASSDPNAADSPWHNPEQIFKELDDARVQVTQAWDQLLNTSSNNDEAFNKIDPEDLRASYIDMITDAFGDVLEEMRQKEMELDVDILVDCLRSGLDLMNQEDKEYFAQDSDNNNNIDDQYEESPHEMRRRQLGFQTDTSAQA